MHKNTSQVILNYKTSKHKLTAIITAAQKNHLNRFQQVKGNLRKTWNLLNAIISERQNNQLTIK